MKDENLALLKMFLISLGLTGNLWQREEKNFAQYRGEIEKFQKEYGFHLMAIDGLKFVIIGPPGAGKSFVMYTLAKIFGKELLSQDDMEERALAKIALNNKNLMHEVYSHQVSLKQAIKEEYGKRWIENFRISILKNMIKRAKDNPFLLLDINGKVGLSSHMINMLKQNGFKIIYLQMLEEEIFAHFQDNLDEINARTNIKAAYEKGEIKFSELLFQIADRNPIYEKNADVVVGIGVNPMETLAIVTDALFDICKQK